MVEYQRLTLSYNSTYSLLFQLDVGLPCTKRHTSKQTRGIIFTLVLTFLGLHTTQVGGGVAGHGAHTKNGRGQDEGGNRELHVGLVGRCCVIACGYRRWWGGGAVSGADWAGMEGEGGERGKGLACELEWHNLGGAGSWFCLLSFLQYCSMRWCVSVLVCRVRGETSAVCVF
jgi:hypothetical protein